METRNGIKTVYAKDRVKWRSWLNKYHRKETAVWLIIYHKEAYIPSVYYAEAVEEALCFGWIDSRANKRDEHSYYLYFALRKPKSNWSNLNRERALKLIKQRLMRSAGAKMIELAKKTGTWTALESPQKSIMPADLTKLLNTNKVALKNFKAFPASSKRLFLNGY